MDNFSVVLEYFINFINNLMMHNMFLITKDESNGVNQVLQMLFILMSLIKEHVRIIRLTKQFTAACDKCAFAGFHSVQPSLSNVATTQKDSSTTGAQEEM